MNLNEFYGRVKHAMKDSDRKPNSQIWKEYIWLKLTKPLIAEQYFNKYLYRKDAGNLKDYLNTNRIHKKFWNINDPRYTPAFENKSNFSNYLAQNNINVVENFAYSQNALFFLNGTLKFIRTESEFRDFLLSLPVKRSIMIKKKEDSWGGKNIFKITQEALKHGTSPIKDVYNTIIQAGYIYQDEIIPHEDQKKLNPNSINCIRVVTYTNKNKETRILGITQKISLTNSFIDNVSYGGGFIPVDLEKGSLHKYIYTSLEKGHGGVYTVHPISGIKVKGLKVPYFKELKELALKAASCFPEIILVGWDIAIQPDGPIIIEGNIRPGLNDQEIAQKGYRKNPVYLTMLAEANEKPIYTK